MGLGEFASFASISFFRAVKVAFKFTTQHRSDILTYFLQFSEIHGWNWRNIIHVNKTESSFLSTQYVDLIKGKFIHKTKS